MNRTLLFLACCSFFIHAHAQTSLVNFNGNSWKDPQTWLFSQIPSDSDDVVLAGDIVIDTNATCRSLTSNGYHVTIATGRTLTIKGADSSSNHVNDSLLTRLEVFWDLNGPTFDPSKPDAVMLLEYDSLKRVTRLIDYSNETGVPSDTSTYYRYYNGNNRFPYFVRGFYNCLNGVCDNDSSYYRYDGSGKVIFDSSITNTYSGNQAQRNVIVDNYQINSNNISRFRYQNNHIETEYFVQSTLHGNVVYQKDSLEYDYTAEHLLRYDQKKNPFYGCSIPIPIFRIENFLLDDAQQPNNLLERREIIDWGSWLDDYTIRYIYKYGINNFPSELYVWADGGSPSLFKFYYSN